MSNTVERDNDDVKERQGDYVGLCRDEIFCTQGRVELGQEILTKEKVAGMGPHAYMWQMRREIGGRSSSLTASNRKRTQNLR